MYSLGIGKNLKIIIDECMKIFNSNYCSCKKKHIINMTPENLDEFRCCLSDDRHFIIQPITLTKCGHSACKECFPNHNQISIQCKRCNIFSEFDLKASQVSVALKLALKFLYENMFHVIEKETSSKIKDLKSD
jgi:hypothetical protein